MTFNLLRESWIPVLWKNGTVTRVGILEALTESNRIRQIGATNPMDRLAVLRFLLALLYWCKGSPPEFDYNIEVPFPPDWFVKLEEHLSCFELLGTGARFYQRKPHGASESKLTSNYLIHEVPTGTNSWHFRHSVDKKDGLCPACCALGLIRLPIFATSGGRGIAPGVNQKPPVYVVPVGRSLAETLALSWRKISDSQLGIPTWENPETPLPPSGAIPLLQGLTWVPRRIWLDDPGEPEAACIACGRGALLIRECIFAGTGSAKPEGDQSRSWEDPHVVLAKQGALKPTDPLGSADAGSGKWADVVRGILAREDLRNKATLWIVSFATVQNAKFVEAMEYNVPLSTGLDQEKADASSASFEKWQKETWKLSGKAKPRGTTRKHLEIAPVLAAIRPQVEARVFSHLERLSSGNAEDWSAASREYVPMMRAVANSLSPGYTTAALSRRRWIAGISPNMREEATTDAPGPKKRGQK